MIRRLLLLSTLFAFGAQANPILTESVADDANGIAEDQTLGGAGNLTLDGALVTGGIARMPQAQIISIESTGNLSGVTFTITCKDADFKDYSEAITGPNNATVKSVGYCRQLSQIAADGAVGTNVEVGVLAADGMVTETIVLDPARDSASLTAQLYSGSGTFGMQYTVDNLDSNVADWQDAVDSSGAGLDPDSNTATGSVSVYERVWAVRGKSTAGTGRFKFTVLQAK